MAIRLEARIVLVTGASSGIGMRFAEVLAEAGATVVMAARRYDRLHETASEWSKRGLNVHALKLDVADVASFPQRFDELEDLAGGAATILVNAAGVAAAEPAAEMTLEKYAFQFDVNVRGPLFVSKAFASRLLPSKTAGRIINVSSVVGLRPFPNLAVYGMTKAALIHMTKSLALEWGPHGIQTSAICPGYVLTDMNAQLWETDRGKQLKDRLPRKRVGEPRDLDDALLFLAGSDSDFNNGAVLSVDDGLAVWF